jgi:Dihydrofolate reductase
MIYNIHMLSMIVAIARNGVIGRDNQLPWHLPADLKYFKETTTGKAVLMGKNTYDSIVGYLGHGLPNRENIVLTSDTSSIPEVTTVHTVESALELAKSRDIFIIGGRKVYETFLPYVDELYITWVEANIEGDVTFPKLNLDEFTEISKVSRPRDAKNIHDLTFSIYRRK